MAGREAVQVMTPAMPYLFRQGHCGVVDPSD
jgi:hypothetical protein